MVKLMLPSKKEFDYVVNKIIQKSEYAHLKYSLKDFLAKIKKAITDWLFRLLEKNFSNLKNSFEISDTLSTIFMIIGIILICAIIVIIIVKINKTFEKQGEIKEILGEKISNNTTPNSLRNKAESFKKYGDYRKAIRYDFIAVLLLMHRKNVVYLDETKTNKEIYKYLLKNEYSMSSNFKLLADSFNYYWYGHKNCGENEYLNFSNTFDELWNEVIGFEKKN